MTVPFSVSVMPGINRVPLGETATFECLVHGDVHVDQYSWVGSEKVARDERFSYSNDKRNLHVNDLKDYDNNTWVDCTVLAGGGREMSASGRIVVLPSDEPMEEEVDGLSIPSIAVAGGVVIGIGFVLVIVAMFLVLRWLKNKEIQKHQDMETCRNRYSRISVGPTAQARYDRGQDNVRLGRAYGYGNEEEGVNDDSYEDMLPMMPKNNVSQPGKSSPRGSPGALRPPARGGGNGPRYQPPARY